jgi:hypothetical protein
MSDADGSDWFAEIAPITGRGNRVNIPANVPKHAPLKKILEFTENIFTYSTVEQTLTVRGPGGMCIFSAIGIEELRGALRGIGKDAGE